MNDVQLLAHLLGMAGLDTTSAREASHSLLDGRRELQQVLDLPQEKLLGDPLLGEGAATFLLLLSALIKRYTHAASSTTPLQDSKDVYQLLAPHFSGQRFERVCAFLLGKDLQPFTSVLVGQGGPAAVTFSIRRLLDLVLNHRASGVILAHNHPDGVLAFSRSDLTSTYTLAQELALIDVPLLDHYLVAGKHILSLRYKTVISPPESFPIPFPLLWFPQVE